MMEAFYALEVGPQWRSIIITMDRRQEDTGSRVTPYPLHGGSKLHSMFNLTADLPQYLLPGGARVAIR